MMNDNFGAWLVVWMFFLLLGQIALINTGNFWNGAWWFIGINLFLLLIGTIIEVFDRFIYRK